MRNRGLTSEVDDDGPTNIKCYRSAPQSAIASDLPYQYHINPIISAIISLKKMPFQYFDDNTYSIYTRL